jgi:curved DNA-binding protein CbpA
MALNHYLLLGIPPDADQQRIKAAYRSLAKRFHPDANQGSEAAAELFRQINEAYRVLSDVGARARYDRALPTGPRPTPPKSRPAPENPPATEPQEKFGRFLNSLLDALFGSLEPSPPAAQSGRRAPQPPKAGPARGRSPAFSFYFHLAMEKGGSPYRQDPDGIIRPPPQAPKPPGAASGFGRLPRGCVLLILLTGLLSLLSP